MKYDADGNRDLDKTFNDKFQKKVNSIFNRQNPYHGQCKKCEYEICIRCGLDYHLSKNCRNKMDEAMKEYFQGLNPGSITNCPKCGLIIEKEAGGCNHMICSKCNYQFCWICGAKYNVEHFDASNVFGCQGLQTADPFNRWKVVWFTLLSFVTIPLTLIFYPVYILFVSFHNPFNMPKRWRWLCFCKHQMAICDNCFCSCLMFLIFAPVILVLGLLLGALNCAIFIIPAYIKKLYTLFKMVLFWKCLCCLNRHK